MSKNLHLDWDFEPVSNDLKILVHYPDSHAEAPQVQLKCRATKGLTAAAVPTLEEIAAKYLDERKHLKPSTLQTYREALQYLLPKYGKQPVNQIDPHELAVFRSELAVRFKPRTVNKITGFLRAVLRYAIQRKMATTDPGQYLGSVAEEASEIDPFTPEELAAAFKAIKPRYRAYFICAAWTGARPSELMALRWRNVNLEDGFIRIRTARVRGKEGKPKTRTSRREIPLFGPAKKALEEQMGISFSDVNNYVFTSRNHGPFTKHMDKMWARALKRAGVRHRPPYQLRHTFASLMLAAGETPAYVAKLLGHTTLETLFRHYARWIPNASQEDGKRFSQLIASIY